MNNGNPADARILDLIQQISMDVHTINEKVDNVQSNVHEVDKSLVATSTKLERDHQSLRELVEREDETLKGRVANHGKEIDDLKTEKTKIQTTVKVLTWLASAALGVASFMAIYFTIKGGL